ncbi:hypothetical protein BKA62DRAFT_726187 [Auriculariales sp. MPI-PUGE-AT-0066]|nr:hypothetical protein BKA62DRAFT_726187 [Auriculariales sp. MPI-PUGE-AT-0066]
MAPIEQVLAHPVTTAWEAGWTYPFKGFWYFLTHPFLWPLLRGRLLPCAILSTFVMINLFMWTYLPQVAFLYVLSGFGPGAWINGTFLVLSEGAAIVAILFEAFFVDETLVDIFDAVLVERGHEDLVRNRRPVVPRPLPATPPEPGPSHPSHPAHPSPNPVQRLGPRDARSVFSPFNCRQILELVLFLPLNIIPFVGVPLYMILTGYRAGPLQHWRYFKFLRLKGRRRKDFIDEWRHKYTGFGTAALCLQLIPVVNMLFLMTSAAGAALFAELLEEKRRQVSLPPVAGVTSDPHHIEEGRGRPRDYGSARTHSAPS